MKQIKLNKNGKVDVVVLENDYEGNQNTVWAAQDDGLAQYMVTNWDLKVARNVWVEEQTKEEFLQSIRTGMEWTTSDQSEIEKAVSEIVFVELET